MTNNYDEQEMQVLLDFQGNLPPYLFRDSNIKFHIHNLDSKTPIVQINNEIFEGSYGDSIGTNLFFEEIANPESRDIYEKDTPIRLQYVSKQCKVLTLVPKFLQKEESSEEEPEKEHDEKKTFKDFQDDYSVILEKFEKGLNVEEYVENVPLKSIESDEDAFFDEVDKLSEIVFKIPEVPPKKTVKRVQSIPS